MRLQVEVAAMRDPFEFPPAPREVHLDVDGATGIVGELLLVVVAEAQVLRAQAQRAVPAHALRFPVLEPLEAGPRIAEELHLHLLKLARAEDELAGGDLVAKRFADLRDAEREAAARTVEHVLEVDEHPLRGLRPHVRHRSVVLDRPHVRPHQQVEVPLLGEFPHRAAARAGVLHDVVDTHPRAAFEAVDQRVGEGIDMPGGAPDLGVGDDRGLDAHNVVALLHHRAPPQVADVAPHLHAKRAIVVRRGEAPVDLGRWKDEPSPLRKRGDRIEVRLHLRRRTRCLVTHRCAPLAAPTCTHQVPARRA